MSTKSGPSIETSFAAFAQSRNMYEYWVSNDYVASEPRTQYDDGYEVGLVYINGALMGSSSNPSSAFGGGGSNRVQYDAYSSLQSVLQDALRTAREMEAGREDLTMTNLSIIRMETNVSGQGMDIHLRFSINGEELWGVFRRYGIDRLPVFTSELNDRVKDRVANTKLVGVLRNTLDKWLTPKAGVYKCLSPVVRVVSESGELSEIHKGTVAQVLRASADKLQCTLLVRGKKYTLSGANYLRFNYWFEKKS